MTIIQTILIIILGQIPVIVPILAMIVMILPAQTQEAQTVF